MHGRSVRQPLQRPNQESQIAQRTQSMRLCDHAEREAKTLNPLKPSKHHASKLLGARAETRGPHEATIAAVGRLLGF